jgi:hypothetical protein
MAVRPRIPANSDMPHTSLGRRLARRPVRRASTVDRGHPAPFRYRQSYRLVNAPTVIDLPGV